MKGKEENPPQKHSKPVSKMNYGNGPEQPQQLHRNIWVTTSSAQSNGNNNAQNCFHQYLFFKESHFSSLFTSVNGSWIDGKYNQSNEKILHYILLSCLELVWRYSFQNDPVPSEPWFVQRNQEEQKPLRSLSHCQQGCGDLCRSIFHWKCNFPAGISEHSANLRAERHRGVWGIGRDEFCWCSKGRERLRELWEEAALEIREGKHKRREDGDIREGGHDNREGHDTSEGHDIREGKPHQASVRGLLMPQDFSFSIFHLFVILQFF